VVHDQGKYRIDADGTLELIGLARSDAGGYTCIADNGVGSPALKQVHLEVAGTCPRRSTQPPLTAVTHSSSRVLCSGLGFSSKSS